MAQWQHGLFGCFDNITLCCISCVFPWYQLGKNAEAVGESCFIYCLADICGFGICAGVAVRGKIREKKNIEGGICSDCMAHICCHLCALVQEAQEVQDLVQSMARE